MNNLSVTFRHLDSSEALRKHAIERLEHIKKYLDHDAQIHVVLSSEKHSQRADIQISSHGMILRGKEDSGDLYNSIERAVDKIEKQIRRYRDKLIDHKPRLGSRKKIKFQTIRANNPIIESKEVEARPMILEEACMQMDLLGTEILVFLNAKTEHLNVLYRKKGERYGLIEAA